MSAAKFMRSCLCYIAYLSLASIQVDLRDALAMNVVLAESYHKLQCEFIAAKTLALRVLGRKLDLETSLKDHKQVSSDVTRSDLPLLVYR